MVTRFTVVRDLAGTGRAYSYIVQLYWRNSAEWSVVVWLVGLWHGRCQGLTTIILE